MLHRKSLGKKHSQDERKKLMSKVKTEKINRTEAVDFLNDPALRPKLENFPARASEYIEASYLVHTDLSE